MRNRTKYFVIFILSFLVYGNTLFHDYALDDAIVITENEYTLNGVSGIKYIFSEELFNGFFEQKDKKLVAGGRYRPLSIATFAVEWELIMGSPFDGVDINSLQKKLNKSANQSFILPSQKLLKDLTRTIHIDNRIERNKQQEAILANVKELTSQEKSKILSNLRHMLNNRSKVLFLSHFVNVLLFAVTCLLLFILLEILFKQKENQIWYLSVPLVVTLIFLVHPIHTEVVANIKGRDEILSLLGSLIAMFLTFKYIQKQKGYLLVLIFISFLVGLFSKEVAVTFVVIIPLSIYFFSKSDKKFQLGILSVIPLLTASLIYFYVRHKVVGGLSFEPSSELMNNSFLGMTFSEKYATIFYTLILYLKLIIFPHPLTFDYYPYHIPIMIWSFWPVVSVIVYIGIGIYALLGIKKKNPVSYGILFYLIALSPMSNVLFPIGVFMNERFVYSASIGIILIIAYLLTNQNFFKNKKYSVYILVAILILFSIKTISRNRVWKNDFTLFTNDVRISGNSAKSNTSAGGKLIEEAVKPENKSKKKEYLTKAIKYLNQAIKIHPSYNDAYLLMGNAQWEMYQSLDSTFKYYESILKANPKYIQVYNNIYESKISEVFEDASKAESNIRVLHKLKEYYPNYFKTNYYLGRIYGRYLHDIDKSKNYLEKAAIINPNNISVFKDLGVVYGISKEYKKSADAFEKAVKLDSDDPVLKLNLAMTYANLKQFDLALNYMEQILNMDIQKKNAQILITLGNMYQNLGHTDKAQQSLIKAQQLNPDLFSK